ncbi:MAG: glycoside hydrolase family 127 protein [Kiritimatiellae bacterium]|nr:glycoside hydrolase family 127 protein [Kiritimatiellia bacterium]
MSDRGIIDNASSPHSALRSVGLTDVKWTTGFWADRFAQCRDATLPHLYARMDDPEIGHALTNFRIAAGELAGEFAGVHWQDGWVYKWLEAAAAVYGVNPDPELDRSMDAIIALIAKVQRPDGYIHTEVILRGMARYRHANIHELYVMGHLVTAACVHHRMTGKTNFLDIARRVGDYVHSVFMACEPALAGMAHNPTIIMGCVELYRVTGERKYLDVARAFVDMRGTVPGGTDQTQDRVRLRDEHTVVGHAVFWSYLFAGVADVYMEQGDASLLDALHRLWADLTEKKLYLTGGVCPIHYGLSVRRDPVCEAAGPEYWLPNAAAYNELCAQIGSFMWNWRMLNITAEAKYADLMEQTLYNGVLPGIGLDGRSWFYVNVLRCHGAYKPPQMREKPHNYRYQPGEPPRRGEICCPSNLLRLIAELHGYVYTRSDAGLWVHQYGGSLFDGTLADGARLRLRQDTAYPWDGEITFTVEHAPARKTGLHLRIPGWAERPRIEINGRRRRTALQPGSYAAVRQVWRAGDVIRLSLPMPARLIEAHPYVEELRNHVAVMRGPLVYCLEAPDMPEGVRVPEVRMTAPCRLAARHDGARLGGVTVLEGDARHVPEGDWTHRLYRPHANPRRASVPIRMIPLYAWANRGIAEMNVWLPLA